MYLFLKANSMNLMGRIRLLTFLASPINNKRLRPLKTIQIIPILAQSKIRIPPNRLSIWENGAKSLLWCKLAVKYII